MKKQPTTLIEFLKKLDAGYSEQLIIDLLESGAISINDEETIDKQQQVHPGDEVGVGDVIYIVE